MYKHPRCYFRCSSYIMQEGSYPLCQDARVCGSLEPASRQQENRPRVLPHEAPGTILRAAKPAHGIVLCASPHVRTCKFYGYDVSYRRAALDIHSSAREVRSLCRLRCSRQLTPSCFGMKHSLVGSAAPLGTDCVWICIRSRCFAAAQPEQQHRTTVRC